MADHPNQFDGSADNVVQAGTVFGGVHNHAPPRRRGPMLGLALGAVVLVVAGGLVVLLDRNGAGRPGDGQPPLAVRAEPSLPKDCHGGWVVPDTGDTPIPMDAKPAGAVLSDGGQVTMTLQGLTSSAVVLESMRVQVVSRKPAARGVVLPAYCASDVVPRSFRVDLGRPAPAVQPQDGQRAGEVIKAGDFPYKISDTDPEQFVVTALSPTEDVEWRLVLAWSSGAQHGEVVVDDGGRPFRSTATTNARYFCPDANASKWHLPSADAPCGMLITPSYARYLTPAEHTGPAGTLDIGYTGTAHLTYHSRTLTLAAASVSTAQLVLTVRDSQDPAIPAGATFTLRPDGDRLVLTDPNGTATAWN